MSISKTSRRLRRAVVAMLAVVGVFTLAHVYVARASRMKPPVAPPSPALATLGETRVVGSSFTRITGGIREIHLRGTAAEIGAAHGTLVRDRMMANESVLWGELERVVPIWPARLLLLDLGRYRYRNVDSGIPQERKLEIAAEAQAAQPDLFAHHMPTYDRLVMLHSLYDIALSFEHSPLVGCSTFALGPTATKDGHALLARAFDFEVGDIFDKDKAVYFVESPGKIAFASVAWPGLVGVVSGMNAEGVALVVHGGRAREARTSGIPVVFSMRDVLERAHDTAEAVKILAEHDVMVSHIVAVTDAKGRFAVVERAPGERATVRETFVDRDRAGVTNHFEGPLASDPKNETVRAGTTTLARRARLDEMLKSIGPNEADVPRAVAMLRDHECAGGERCGLGDRRAIDAFIATHGIVADTTARVLWVSAGPQLSGQFVAFDLARAFAAKAEDAPSVPAMVPADDVLGDARYREGRARSQRALTDKGERK